MCQGSVHQCHNCTSDWLNLTEVALRPWLPHFCSGSMKYPSLSTLNSASGCLCCCYKLSVILIKIYRILLLLNYIFFWKGHICILTGMAEWGENIVEEITPLTWVHAEQTCGTRY